MCCKYFSDYSEEDYNKFYYRIELFYNSCLPCTSIIVTGDFNLPTFGATDDLSQGNNFRKTSFNFFLNLCLLRMFINARNIKNNKTLNLIISNYLNLDISLDLDPFVSVDDYHPSHSNTYLKLTY